MARQTENSRDWLERHLRELMAIGGSIRGCDDNLPSHLPTYEKGYWTALKLVCLKYYIPVYLNILRKKGWRVAYVDLFAGPGLNLIGDAKVPLPGSPLIAVEHPGTRWPFDFHVFGDTNTEYVDALQKRLGFYRNSEKCRLYSDAVETVKMDANELVKELPELMKEHSIRHSLVFADPEGLELTWDAVKYLSENLKYSDWIILFPSAGLNRLMGRRDDASWNRIRDFIGPNSELLRDNPTEERAVGLYMSNLASLGKDISTEIAVVGTGSFHYHLIPAVRTTKGESPWFQKCFSPAKQKIESLSGEVLKIVMQQIEGKQSILETN